MVGENVTGLRGGTDFRRRMVVCFLFLHTGKLTFKIRIGDFLDGRGVV